MSMTVSLPGVSGAALAEGFAFFESEVGEIYNDIGDIWGTEESLDWVMELDADIFGDPNVAKGLPVVRPVVEEPRMRMSDLAQAVREAQASAASPSIEVNSTDRLMPERKVHKDMVPKKKEAQQIWDFAAFEQVRPSPPARLPKVSRDSDVGLLDILVMKVQPAAPVASAVVVGSSAPRFPDLPPVKPAKEKSIKASKKKTVSREKIVEESVLGVGEATQSFLDLLPARKEGSLLPDTGAVRHKAHKKDKILRQQDEVDLPLMGIVDGVVEKSFDVEGAADDTLHSYRQETVKNADTVSVLNSVGSLLSESPVLAVPVEIPEASGQTDVIIGQDTERVNSAQQTVLDVSKNDDPGLVNVVPVSKEENFVAASLPSAPASIPQDPVFAEGSVGSMVHPRPGVAQKLEQAALARRNVSNPVSAPDVSPAPVRKDPVVVKETKVLSSDVSGTEFSKSKPVADIGRSHVGAPITKNVYETPAPRRVPGESKSVSKADDRSNVPFHPVSGGVFGLPAEVPPDSELVKGQLPISKQALEAEPSIDLEDDLMDIDSMLAHFSKKDWKGV